MGRSSEGMVGGWVQQTDRQQRAVLQKIRYIAAENPCPLSPMVQIIFSRHNCVFRAKYILCTHLHMAEIKYCVGRVACYITDTYCHLQQLHFTYSPFVLLKTGG